MRGKMGKDERVCRKVEETERRREGEEGNRRDKHEREKVRETVRKTGAMSKHQKGEAEGCCMH